MKYADRKIKKDIIRLSRFYKKNGYNIIRLIINALQIDEDINIMGQANLYNGEIDNSFAKERHNSNEFLLACTHNGDIHVFVDRVIKEAVLMIKFKENKYKNNIKRVFVAQLAHIFYHEFYHLKQYEILSKEEFLNLVENLDRFGVDEKSELYCDTEAAKLVDKYIKYIFILLKI